MNTQDLLLLLIGGIAIWYIIDQKGKGNDIIGDLIKGKTTTGSGSGSGSGGSGGGGSGSGSGSSNISYTLVTDPGIPDPTGQEYPAPMKDFTDAQPQSVLVVSKQRNMCLGAQDGGSSNGTPIWYENCGNGDSTAWTYDGTLLKHKKSGKCVTVDGNNPNDNGARMYLWDCGGAKGSWKYDASKKQFKNVGSGKCLNVRGGWNEPHYGRQIVQWDCVTADNNSWIMYPSNKTPKNLIDASAEASDPRYYFGSNVQPSPPRPAIASYINAEVYDLFPFKIVPLGSIPNDKYLMVYIPTNSGTVTLIQFKFDQSSEYLPMGDMMVRGRVEDANGINLKDVTYVAMIRNTTDEKYAARISPSDLKFVWRSRGCNWGGLIVSVRGIKTLDRVYKDDYLNIGDFFNITKDGGSQAATVGIVPQTQHYDTTWYDAIGGNRWYAAPKKKYVSWSKPSYTDNNLIITDISGDYSCDNHIRTQLTSAFHTFNTQSDEDTGGLQRNFDGVWGGDVRINNDNPVWPTLMYFQLVPQILAADCCAGTLPGGVTNSVCSYWDAAKCKDGHMAGWCKGENMLSDACYAWCRKPENDCSSSLNTYCQSAERNNLHPNYDKVCSCFYGNKYYQYQRDKMFQGVDKTLYDKLLGSLGVKVRPECSDYKCMDSATIKPYQVGTCPSLQIQQCINSFNVNQQGSAQTGNEYTNQMVNDCVQQAQK
jgi:hypothetical protein